MLHLKITIITPSFQQGSFIEKTIQSVIAQNYPEVEHMIFDAGSTDQTLEIIKKYENHIHFWQSEPDKGQSDAINKGFRRATGEIVTWLNSDDQLLPNTLHRINEVFQENPEVFLVHGKTILFGTNRADFLHSAPDHDLEKLYLAGLPFAQPSSFFKRQSILDFGLLDQSLHYAMDYDLFVRIALNHKMLKINDILSKYLIHENSKTTLQNIGFAEEYAKVFSRVLRSFSFSNPLIEKMQFLGLYDEGTESYPVGQEIDLKSLEKAFCYNLRYQLNFYYDELEVKKSRLISQFLVKLYPDFCKEYPEIKQIALKTQFLNKKLMQWLRKIKRKFYL